MKKTIFFIFILLLFSCSNIQKRENLSENEKMIIKEKIYEIQNEILHDIKLNKKEKIKEKVADTFKNNIILNYINNYDLEKILIIFSEDIDIINSENAQSLGLINFDIHSFYFNIHWKKNDKKSWYIYDVSATE